MNLSGKVAVVTGASRGIGRAIAINLSKAGVSVLIGCSKDETGLKETEEIIKSSGGYCISKMWNIANYEQCKEISKFTYDHFGKIDILVNNAGVSRIGLFMDMEEGNWNSLIDVNIKGMLNMTHNIISYMLKGKGGNIVNISSIWGNSGASCETVYSATKGAVNSFTKALAKEMGLTNIKVNAISPGVINTEMNKWMSKEDSESLKEEIALGRFGEPKEIADAVLFLCSDMAGYITGQVLTVDGGYL